MKNSRHAISMSKHYLKDKPTGSVCHLCTLLTDPCTFGGILSDRENSTYKAYFYSKFFSEITTLLRGMLVIDHKECKREGNLTEAQFSFSVSFSTQFCQTNLVQVYSLLPQSVPLTLQ